jgi:hypothetical protein
VDIPAAPADGQLGRGTEASGLTLPEQMTDSTRHLLRRAIGDGRVWFGGPCDVPGQVIMI